MSPVSVTMIPTQRAAEHTTRTGLVENNLPQKNDPKAPFSFLVSGCSPTSFQTKTKNVANSGLTGFRTQNLENGRNFRPSHWSRTFWRVWLTFPAQRPPPVVLWPYEYWAKDCFSMIKRKILEYQAYLDGEIVIKVWPMSSFRASSVALSRAGFHRHQTQPIERTSI